MTYDNFWDGFCLREGEVIGEAIGYTSFYTINVTNFTVAKRKY